jgi:hypothetical protein
MKNVSTDNFLMKSKKQQFRFQRLKEEFSIREISEKKKRNLREKNKKSKEIL